MLSGRFRDTLNGSSVQLDEWVELYFKIRVAHLGYCQWVHPLLYYVAFFRILWRVKQTLQYDSVKTSSNCYVIKWNFFLLTMVKILQSSTKKHGKYTRAIAQTCSARVVSVCPSISPSVCHKSVISWKVRPHKQRHTTTSVTAVFCYRRSRRNSTGAPASTASGVLKSATLDK